MLGLAFALFAAQAGPGFAQVPGVAPKQDTSRDTTRDSTTAAPPVDVSPLSPRYAVRQFITLTRAGRYEEAARYLDLPESQTAVGAELARRFKSVLDRHLWIDFERISPLATGDTADDLPPGVDELGVVPGPTGRNEAVRVVRRPGNADAPWQFARSTVERIPVWYAGLENRWVLENIPEALQRPGPLDLYWWQWIAVPLLLLVSWPIGVLVGRLLRAIVVRVARRTSVSWDEALFSRISGPLAAILTLAVLAALLPLIGLTEPAADRMYRLIRAAVYVAFFWGLWRVVDIAVSVFAASAWARSTPASRSLLPLGRRLAKALLFAIAAVAVLSMLGYPVASLVAGLGLGGLALALAAQKTVENLFGSFSIGVDQPFREGDFVKIEDFVGTVEAIGLRSTRIRTLDRTLITLPNGKLADMRLESFTVRDRLRLFTTFGLAYGTTAAQMRQILAGIEQALASHPKIWPDAYPVRFVAFDTSSLNVEVMAWFQTTDWNEFTKLRQELLLQFMEIVEKAGASFALPARRVHLAASPNGAPMVASGGT
ncbi:MAG TPA: mechanosensitive ion channel family protein [Gemmatimonadaceae bacterium]